METMKTAFDTFKANTQAIRDRADAMYERQHKEIAKMTAELKKGFKWCECPDGFDHAYYVPDNVSKICTKHHWACEVCKGIIQVG